MATASADTTAMTQEHERKIIRLEAKVEMLEQKTERLEDELKVYQASAISADKKMTQVLAALVGDDTMHTKGMIQRMESIEDFINWLKEVKWKLVGGGVAVGAGFSGGLWLLEKLWK